MLDWLHRRWRAWRDGKTWREANTRYISEDGSVSTSMISFGYVSNKPIHLGSQGAFLPGHATFGSIVPNSWLEGTWLAQQQEKQ